MSNQRPSSPVVRSALWAAWGDALGFPFELRDRRGTGGGADKLQNGPAAWRRRIGGRFGPTLELPAGTYSDDTQLRLAVSRCIRAHGRFDVEAFSKVELPIFLSYALGAGRGTRAAATALRTRSARWTSNFFDARGSRYVDSGGNGAAMRIQPHVWVARNFDPNEFLAEVVRDSLVTHGHPRGVLGAALHSLTLGIALREGELPPPDRWKISKHLARLQDVMMADDQIAERWIPLWEKAVGRSWSEALKEHMEELADQLSEAAETAATAVDSPLEAQYASICRRLGGLASETVGAGTVSAVLSLWLAWKASDRPADAVVIAASLRGSDTDTIASMTGALVGVVATEDPRGELLDLQLHRGQAERLDRLRSNEVVEDFPHPDLLHWEAPKTLSDAVGTLRSGLAVAGLGSGSPIGEVHTGSGDEGMGWQWLKLWFGQTVLIKRRLELAPLPAQALPHQRPVRSVDEQPDLFTSAAGHSNGPLPKGRLPNDIDAGVDLVIRSHFERSLIGDLLIHYAGQPQGREKAGIFAALVAGALSSRTPTTRTSQRRRESGRRRAN